MTSLIADLVIFGMIAVAVIVNTAYGICLLIRWIWKRLRKKKNGNAI